MSREEAHKILDKVLDAGYCGDFLVKCFKGSAGPVRLLDQTIKSVDEIIMVTI